MAKEQTFTRTEFFSLDKLKDFDGGKMLAAFGEEMKYAAMSCNDRPNDKSPRKVTLEFSLTPVVEPNTGACEGVKLTMKAKSKVPERKSKAYELGIRANGSLLFSNANPENVNQRHIDEEIEKNSAGDKKPAVKPEVVTKPKSKSDDEVNLDGI